MEGIKIGRKLREWYPGATYHIMERGVRRLCIFQDDFDFMMFKEIMRAELSRHECKLHAYCLMTNHFHLLLETKDIEVSKFMKNLASKYAMQYNHRHSLKGHVFEGRYVSCLVRTDEYFLQTSRYIHLNPLKAKMVTKAEYYIWSSYRDILGISDDKMTDRDKTLGYFRKKGIWGYRNFVEDIGHKYIVDEDEIRNSMGEDELWLPW